MSTCLIYINIFKLLSLFLMTVYLLPRWILIGVVIFKYKTCLIISWSWFFSLLLFKHFLYSLFYFGNVAFSHGHAAYVWGLVIEFDCVRVCGERAYLFMYNFLKSITFFMWVQYVGSFFFKKQHTCPSRNKDPRPSA